MPYNCNNYHIYIYISSSHSKCAKVSLQGTLQDTIWGENSYETASHELTLTTD